MLLVDYPKPGPCTRDVSWCREMLDGVQELRAGFDVCRCYCHACEFDSVFCELELLRVQCDSIASAQIQPTACLEKCLLDASCPHACVIHVFLFVWKVCDDGVKTLVIAISTGEESLWGNFISVSPPGWNRGCDMSIIRVNGDGMIAIPGVRDCFHCVLWDAISQVKWT